MYLRLGNAIFHFGYNFLRNETELSLKWNYFQKVASLDTQEPGGRLWMDEVSVARSGIRIRHQHWRKAHFA